MVEATQGNCFHLYDQSQGVGRQIHFEMDFNFCTEFRIEKSYLVSKGVKSTKYCTSIYSVGAGR